jgi:pilus assembly protein FimV
LAPGAAEVSLDLASADEDLDLDLSAFEELSADDDELLSAASDLSFDEEDLDLGKAEDDVTVNLGAVAGSESADEDLDLNLDDFDTPLRPAGLDSASKVDELGADLASDDEFFVDAGDGDNAADSVEVSGTESVLNSTETGGIDLEDLSFDEFDVGDDDEEFDNLLDTESVATKLDLARAYVDMGDSEGAREMLEEVLVEGDTQQQSDAQALLDSIGK